MAGNPTLSQAIGIGSGHPLDGFVAATQLHLAVIATGYVIQAIGTPRTEEAEGRLETPLAGTLSRIRWLAAHTAVAATGLVLGQYRQADGTRRRRVALVRRGLIATRHRGIPRTWTNLADRCHAFRLRPR